MTVNEPSCSLRASLSAASWEPSSVLRSPSVAVVGSCEPDYPMLCELAGILGGGLGLTIGVILVGFGVGMALRGTLLKQLSFIAALVILGVGFFFLRLRMSYPRAFRNVLLQNAELWVVASVFLGLIVGGIALLLDLRRQGGSTRDDPARS